MLKNFAKPILYVSVLAFFLSIVVSCEEDFTDIGTTIVNNNQFTTSDTIFEVVVEGKDLDSVQADGLTIAGGALGQYLLGVYNNPNYRKIEASIISQLALPANLALVDDEYGTDTTVVSTIDTVLLRLPYQATFTGTSGIGPEFDLDSIIGDQQQPFTLNVFELESFLNRLNPVDPTQINSFYSNHPYDVSTEKLNFFEDTQFTPNRRDTAQFVLRRLNNGSIYTTDTIRYTNSNPYISIPLKKNRIKQIFLDQYGTSNLSSQDMLDNYFRGIKIQAEGNNGSLISLNLNNTALQPVMDIYYTNTVIKTSTQQVVDTISKTDSFNLQGIRTSVYNVTDGQVPAFNQVAVQGTSGSMAQITLMTREQLEVLREKNWLINDATITMYVDEAVVGSDTLTTPLRLFAFKDGDEVKSQILDVLTEGGVFALDGALNLDDSGNPDSYTFKITDYISELASRDLDDLQPIGIRVFSPTNDTPLDSVVSSHSWNPKAVMLLNHEPTNGARRTTLKISYSERNEENN